MLEFEYQAFNIGGKSQNFNNVELIQGTVNFETLLLKSMFGSEEYIKVRRTPDNVRKRQNGDKRHNPFEGIDQEN